MYFNKKIWIVACLCLSLMMATACTTDQQETQPMEKPTKMNKDIKVEGVLKITGLDKEENIDIKELFAMEPFEIDTESIKSSGEVIKNKIKGILLQDILKKYDTKEENYTAIQMIAGDGYSVVAPKEILQKRDILLAYEVDGEPLSDKAQPLMSAIPNERSMYWVKNLVEIELLTEDAVELDTIVILETATDKLEQSEYAYYEAMDKAVKVEDILHAYTENLDKKSAIIRAVDGLEKEEDIEVLKTGYIKVTGKDKPLFLSPELPKGMHVKQVLTLEYKDNIFISMVQAGTALEKKVFGDEEGIMLEDLLALSNIKKGKVYNLVASDGYEVEITTDMIGKGYIYQRKKGGYTLAFDGMEKEYKVKGIEKIQCVK